MYRFLKNHYRNFNFQQEATFYVPTKKNLLIASFLKIFLKAKIIFHSHNVYENNLLNKFFFSLFRFFIHDVIAVSDAVKNSIFHPRIEKIYNPIHFDINMQKKPFEFPLNVGTVSSLIPYKGIKFFLEAQNNLDQELFIFNIFGDGFLKQKLSTQYPQAKFFGFKSQKEIYRKLDILVIPSIEPEAFSLVILEAMSWGIPVIATNIGAHSELINNNENGILIRAKSSIEISDSLNRLAVEDFYKKISNNGILKFEEFKKENDFNKQIFRYFK